MKEIKLSKGEVALVDDEDFEYLNQWKWRVMISHGIKYAVRTYNIYMHRQIMKTPLGMCTDHINHDGLDNRKCNLRVCTYSQNIVNKTPCGKSKYLGVYFQRKVYNGKDRIYCSAHITVNGRAMALGQFKSEEEAALAYDAAAKKYHGEFANLNFKTK